MIKYHLFYKYKFFLLLSLFILDGTYLFSQSNYDECFSSFRISAAEDFCGDFNTAESTASNDGNTGCWPVGSVSHDIWLSFIATRQSGSITLLRPDADSIFLTDISVVVYGDRCNDLQQIACSSFIGTNSANEIFLSDLTVGSMYYIRVDSRSDATGSFKLCTQLFNTVPRAEQDCPQSVVLCDKSPFVVQFLDGAGRDPDEAAGSCLGNIGVNSEDRSAWYSWTCKESGSLFFTLTPNNIDDPTEDLDFALFTLPSGLKDCSDKELLRCMASGETVGESFEFNMRCFGPTGLRTSSRDTEEARGCELGDDNFLAAIDMIEGESYALLVNNFSASNFGFSLEFGGTGTFLGPEPEFEIDILASPFLQCDQEVIFRDMSTGATDNIVSWSWSFGSGANPQTTTGVGPHRVVYNTFGPKTAVLTVETERGCLIPAFKDVMVDPCCPPGVIITLDPMVENVVCQGDDSGRIDILASGGTGAYLLSLNGGDFLPVESYGNLRADDYQISAVDAKGCTADIRVAISEPPAVEVDAGADQTVDLGVETEILAVAGPEVDMIDLLWGPMEGLSCTDCDNPSVIAPGTTTYSVTATNQLGCSAIDFVTITTIIDRETAVYTPDTFTPNEDSTNDHFRIFAGIAVSEIINFKVYNRWGELIFSAESMPINDDNNIGWDGKYRDLLLPPGTFVWQSDVLFLDNFLKTYSGTVTLLR